MSDPSFVTDQQPHRVAIPRLGQGQLTTLDCVAQSLAVGPVFSAGLLGGILAVLSGGVGSLVIIATMIGILGIGRVVSEFARRYSGSGTVYEFVARSLGNRWAIFATGAYYCFCLIGGPSMAVIGGLLIRDFFALYIGLTLPWWLGATCILALIASVNMVGLQVSVKTQLILTTLSALPFVILIVRVVLVGGTGGNSIVSFNPAHVATGGSVFKGILFAILMFVGFELSAALGEETKDPKRSIPLAVLATILAVAVFYIGTQYALAIGTHQPGQGFAALSRTYLPPIFAAWIDMAVLLDVIAMGIGAQVTAARGVFTLARDGVLPSSLAHLNKGLIPVAANALVIVLSIMFVLAILVSYGSTRVDAHAADSFANAGAFRAFLGFSVVSGMLVCVAYLLLCVGALRTFARRSLIDAAASIVGICTCLLAILAQFIDGTGPEPDYKWGRTLTIVIVLLLAASAAFMKKDVVERVAQYTIEH